MGTKREKNRAVVHESHETEPAARPQAHGFDELDVAILRHLETPRPRHQLRSRRSSWPLRLRRPRGASWRLKTSGAIRGYRALIDDRLLGRQMTVFIRVTLERQSAPVLCRV